MTESHKAKKAKRKKKKKKTPQAAAQNHRFNSQSPISVHHSSVKTQTLHKQSSTDSKIHSSQVSYTFY